MRGPDYVHGNVTTAVEYEARQAMFVAANVRTFPSRYADARVRDESTRATVRIDHGRWLIDCLCGNGVSVSADWAVGRCFSCGRVWRHLVWPADRVAIVAVLALRPEIATQNWAVGESVEHLRAENAAHGIGH